MSAQSKATIKSYFQSGDRPTEGQFIDLVDSYLDVSAAVASGTVVSAGLTMPGLFAVSGSPITTEGNFVVTLSAQAQKQVFLSPASATGVPTFRAMLDSDLPATAVSAGTYTLSTITVNDKGRVTGASNGAGAGIFTLSFESTGQTIAASTAGSVTHGLGVAPKFYFPYIKCTTAELGYSIGDEVGTAPHEHNNYGITIFVDSGNTTTIKWMTSGTWRIGHKTTGVDTSITYANWQLYFRAYA